MRLPFCGHRVVSHFACEILAVLKLACGDTSISEVFLLVGAILLLPVPLAFICLSYTLILATTLRVPSAAGRRKAAAAGANSAPADLKIRPSVSNYRA